MGRALTRNKRWIVRLGDQEWLRHTYPRTPKDGLRLLGSVRRGLQVGALGATEQGEFVQVVGDHLVRLNRAQIARAIAGSKGAGAYQFYRPAERPVSMPVIVVKRRRIPVPA